MSKRLVIDASVAISAGQTLSESIQSNRCHEFLTEIMNGDFLAVMTEEIESEWKDPEKPKQTVNSRKWLTRLYARKRVEWHDKVLNPTLRNKIDKVAHSDKARLAMLEDVHLLEAALATDRIVSSLDTVQQLFAVACVQVEEIRVIVWVNPVKEENTIEWLQAGCPTEKHRQLGYREQQ